MFVYFCEIFYRSSFKVELNLVFGGKVSGFGEGVFIVDGGCVGSGKDYYKLVGRLYIAV